ncbi:MAG TPA: extensin family protein [Xanthobacteraceae bacterium]|nr:extensin family protein [Xanthobacteraceae bacterium]
MKRFIISSFLVSCLAAGLWSSPAHAQDEELILPMTVPMPEPRPAEAPAHRDAGPRFPVLLPVSKEEAAAAANLCKAVLAREKLIAEPAQAAMWDNGCGAVGQITIRAIKLADGNEIPLRPSALIRCETAEAVADWVREELVPATRDYGGVARIEVAASYHCRPRNNVRGARMSEHGRANAIDIRAIVMKDGRRFGVDIPETPIQLLADLRRGACAKFTTVLGPGSDGYHEDHFHMDLAQRRGGYRLCQWQVPAPPEPSPHPQR